MKTFINAVLVVSLLLIVSCSCKEPIDGLIPTDGDPTQTPTAAAELNKKLGPGINLGGAYEGQIGWPYDTSPEVVHGYISEIARLGFEHIRFPINWERTDRSKETSPYTIESEFMTEIKASVDFALSKGLRVIINMQNHDALLDNPDTNKEMFLEQWRQIAWTFRNYSDSVLFEVLNEPYRNMTPAKWNTFLADALSVIRSTPSPSKNKERCVLIGTANQGGPDAIRQLKLPEDDPYLILTVHQYYPFWFTHQNATQYLGTPWDDTEFEREFQRRYADYIDAFAELHNIPVNIGEFGATEFADPGDRIKYTGFLTKLFTQRGYSWTFFNYHYTWGIYNLNTKQYIQPLINAIKDYKSAIPSAHVPAHSDVLYQSNITASNADGWGLWVNSDAAAATTLTSNKITVNIARPGANQWSVQLSRSGLPIIAGRRYAVSFKASSTVAMQRMQAGFTEKEGITSEYYLFYPLEEAAMHHLIFTAQTTQSNGKITIHMGGNPAGSTVIIEDVRFTEFYD